MSRRKKQAAPENHERWLVSYADFITLLFAFFVVMFASSQTDKARATAVSESIRGAIENGGMTAMVREVLGGTVDDKGKGNAMMKGPGGVQRAAKEASPAAPTELIPSMQYLEKELQQEIQAGKIQMELQPRGLVVSLQQAAFFPSGEDSIDGGTYPALQKIAAMVRDLPNAVRLEGHTDSVPIHTARFRSNWELSAARSIATLDLFTTRFGVPHEKLAIAGYADTVPVDSNETEEGRARNRRVDIVIVSQNRLVSEPQAAAPSGAKPEKSTKAPAHGEQRSAH